MWWRVFYFDRCWILDSGHRVVSSGDSRFSVYSVNTDFVMGMNIPGEFQFCSLTGYGWVCINRLTQQTRSYGRRDCWDYLVICFDRNRDLTPGVSSHAVSHQLITRLRDNNQFFVSELRLVVWQPIKIVSEPVSIWHWLSEAWWLLSSYLIRDGVVKWPKSKYFSCFSGLYRW